MTSYTVKQGDTFSRISRRVYGVENGEKLIIAANPGASNPPVFGTVLAIPDNPDAPPSFAQVRPATNPDEIALKIGGKLFRFWTGVTITRSLDSIDTVEFSAPFDPFDPDHREMFRPASFAPVEVFVGGEKQFSGQLVTPTPSLSPDSRTVSVSCYARAGVLNDCTAPASSFPLEFNGQSLNAIASTLCQPFGLSPVFEADPGPAFEQVATKPGENILPFLTGLAQQRGLVISNDTSGNPVFLRSVSPGAPVAILRQGDAPVGDIAPQFSAQSYYSHITGIEPTDVGADGASHTVENPLLRGVLRPHTFIAQDAKEGDIKTVVEAKAGRMFGALVSYAIPISSFRDPAGKLWRPNTSIIVEAPGAMIYSPYEFIVRSVTLSKSGSGATAVLSVVLPGLFSGEIPEVLPWAV